MEEIPGALGRRCRSAGCAALCCLFAALAVAPSTLFAQRSTRQQVDEAHAAYRTARDQHRTALDEWNRLDLAVDSLVAEFESAQDRDLADRLQAQLYERTGLQQKARGELHQLREQWDSAGEALKQVIDNYRLDLVEQWQETGRDPEAEVLGEFRDLGLLRDELVAEMGAPELLELPEMVNIQRLPEGSQADRERKATAYEDYAALLERVWLSRLDEQIDELTKQQQIEEGMRQFNLDIFGGRLPPVGQGGAASGRGGAGDVGQTLAQQIEDLEGLRETVDSRVQTARQRARDLRPSGGAGP